MSAIHAADLVKTYPGGRKKPPVRALDGLSLEVPAGVVYAVLGPNGAGKSTTVKVLTTLARADAGTAEVAGIDVRRDPAAVRSAIGLVSQRSSSEPMSTARESLVLAGLIQGLPAARAKSRAAELLDRFALAEAADRRAGTFSGGMARKLDVAIGLMHRPRVLFLDEPTTGLDPEARAEMWAEIRRLASDEGTTVLLTTHYLEEADSLAARVAIVDGGRVVAEGTPTALKHGLGGDTLQIDLVSPTQTATAAALLERTPGLSQVTTDGVRLRARTDGGTATVASVLRALGDDVLAVTVSQPSLDDVYLRYAGRRFDAAGGSPLVAAGVAA